MTDIKKEVYSILQLSPKYNNDVTALKFDADALPEEVAAGVKAAYDALVEQHVAIRAFGFALREFADVQVGVVTKAIEEAAKQPAPVEKPAPVAKPKKPTKVEPEVVPEPVVEEPVVVAEPVVETATEEQPE